MVDKKTGRHRDVNMKQDAQKQAERAYIYDPTKPPERQRLLAHFLQVQQ
ncbi:hypothetical protein OB236_35190 [Paenibacillus sp. WQ 127069]|uniref:YfhE family protein n=1 Tax=Paenibacillus baimaensis TaxID=2982185 RepID=A0ABT2URW3_9BACL|nr:hypothetical protein [Paenibacillus sp. WQ 127069]